MKCEDCIEWEYFEGYGYGCFCMKTMTPVDADKCEFYADKRVNVPYSWKPKSKEECKLNNMNEFLKFFDEKVRSFPMHLEINYSKICDWQIVITKNGCANDYPEAKNDGDGNVIIAYEQDGDIELCFAKAYIALKKWLIEFDGGY